MFTGIIETMATVIGAERKGTLLELTLQSGISAQLHIDQSVSHNGVCLTVIDVLDDTHRVQLVEETLRRSAFGQTGIGDSINLERAMPADGRFEGHIVQGHVDCTGHVLSIDNGMYTIGYPAEYARFLVQKGSVCVDGVSLTVAGLGDNTFSVAIIPYTYDHTTFGSYSEGDRVNLEFDILGKYLLRMQELK
jgi:riboflavin synthase